MNSGNKIGDGFLSNDRNTKYVATAPHEKAGLKKYRRPIYNLNYYNRGMSLESPATHCPIYRGNPIGRSEQP